jgi:hypothetical protein
VTPTAKTWALRCSAMEARETFRWIF